MKVRSALAAIEREPGQNKRFRETTPAMAVMTSNLSNFLRMQEDGQNPNQRRA
jgi:hypothetical protein